MKYKEISTLSAEDLEDKLITTKETLRMLRFSHAVSPIEHIMEIKKNRRLIAKIKTALKVKENLNNNSHSHDFKEV
jgi:large subunit ribosomal protein L29